MKRVLAIIAVFMCLACSMVPMAFADEVVAASSDVRIAGFDHGLNTLDPSARAGNNEFGGIFLNAHITCKSVSVSDLEWRADDSTQGGYFFLWYIIDVEPIKRSEMDYDDVIAEVPIEFLDGTSSLRVRTAFNPSVLS